MSPVQSSGRPPSLIGSGTDARGWEKYGASSPKTSAKSAMGVLRSVPKPLKR